MTESIVTVAPDETVAFDMPMAVEAVRRAVHALNLAETTGNLPELVENSAVVEGVFLLSPEIMAQLLMVHLPDPDLGEGLPINQKVFWLEAAEWMGPDWLAGLRKVAAFMVKVEGF